MSLSRRRFTGLASLLVIAASTRNTTFAAPQDPVGQPSPTDAGRVAPPQCGPAAPDGASQLPVTAVRPRGWLVGQLRLQLAGLCGRYEETSHFLDFSTSGWVHPERAAWEELSYWLHGYVDLAIVTRDADALATAHRWCDAILTTQRADGFFDTQATYTTYDGVMRSYGQSPGGVFADDENIPDGYGGPRQGFETCGVVELMASHELLTRLTGDPLWADRCEELTPAYDTHATSPRNYGLALDAADLAQGLTFSAADGALAANPFTQSTVPYRIIGPARHVAEWTAGRQPARRHSAPAEPRPQHGPRGDDHSRAARRGPAAHLRLAAGLPHRRPLDHGQRRLPRCQPGQRQGTRRPPDVVAEQRAGRAVRGQRHGRPPVAPALN